MTIRKSYFLVGGPKTGNFIDNDCYSCWSSLTFTGRWMMPNESGGLTFVITPGYKLTHGTASIPTKPADNLFQCCQTCLQRPGCVTFNYQPSLGTCELSPILFTELHIFTLISNIAIEADSSYVLGTATKNVRREGFLMFLQARPSG